MDYPWTIKAQVSRGKHFIYHIVFCLLLSCLCLLSSWYTIWGTSYGMDAPLMCVEHNKLVERCQERCIRHNQITRLYLRINLWSESFHYWRYIVPLASIDSNYAISQGKDDFIYLSDSYYTFYDYCDFEWVRFSPN